MHRLKFAYIVSGIFIVIILASLSCSNVHDNKQEQKIEQEVLKKEILSDEEEIQLASIFTAKKVDEIDALLKIYRKRFRFHGNVLVAYHGMLIYNRSFGIADFTTNRVMDINDRFQLASVSKQFTSTAIMLLAQEGKLDISDTVQRIIPEFPYERVTIEQLLHHTAGMPNYMWLLEHKWEKGRKAYNSDIIRLMKENNTSLYFRPGRRYEYSNTGYAVLAYIVEKVSGIPFADFVQQRIFDPLNMNNSFVYSNASENDYPMHLQGHYRRWKHYNIIKETVHDGIVGDKGVYSTTADLYKWDQSLYTNILLSDSMRNIAFTPVKVRGRYDYPYGYGFRLKKVNGKKVVYHTGLWEGFRTNLMRYVEDKNTIIVLNHTNINVNNVMVKRIESILAKPLEGSNAQAVVSVALKQGEEKAFEYYNTVKQNNDFVDITKILEAANVLSTMGKPQLSGVVIKLYEKINATISLKERAASIKNVV